MDAGEREARQALTDQSVQLSDGVLALQQRAHLADACGRQVHERRVVEDQADIDKFLDSLPEIKLQPIQDIMPELVAPSEPWKAINDGVQDAPDVPMVATPPDFAPDARPSGP